MQTDSEQGVASKARRRDPSAALQAVLWWELAARGLIWTGALVVTLGFGAQVAWVNHSFTPAAVTWGGALRPGCAAFVMLVVYNIAYLLGLAVLRLLIPTPRPGRYSLTTPRPDRNLLYSCALAILTKARYQPPFPAIFVPQLANVAPFRWLLGWRLGPHSRSVFFVEPNIIDPWGITIGRNVTLGFGVTVAAHLQEPDHVSFAPTVIEDDVLVGAFTSIGGGVQIKRGAAIRAHSMVLPGSVIGENEFWGGIPARKMRETPAAVEISKSSTGNAAPQAAT